MKYFNLFSFLILTSGSALTQDIPIDMSLAEFDQTGANLAIHFVEGTTGDRAKEIVEELSYELISFDFGTVMVFGDCQEEMTESERIEIQAHEKIAIVDQRTIQPPSNSTLFGDLKIKFVPKVLVTLRFEPGIGSREARSIASRYKEFNVKSVSSATRDISIKVDTDLEAEAVEKLEAFEEVEYVVYLNTDSVPFLEELEIEGIKGN